MLRCWGGSEQVRYWTETGASGFLVYRYELRRRPGQGELCSKTLVFGGGCAPKNFTAESRKKEVWRPTPLIPFACDILPALAWEAAAVWHTAKLSNSGWR